ncbi:Ras guanine nucleotide exchange factor [Dictyostelium discoideum AX4]|uniref:Ras guanine nucleotide exchange factor I n=1 Tax=Dictyostelium discoideum TaxID=44689 RepID=GEFI_DICDI|nr:Ras guanine nucleotide exchange factor [Dictyostelium discoideum AX4]Q8IS15.1 RecName: Full=Ras guanine nucleotide exchange factor I; AltName: Full=RasGEF domain-containing protein I [Dictyostelium discoideum]AAN46878.1 nucleotide exchange factor RasGEF I [Dictyostelium discoideum]EAL68130.1 Ras guanine nucleotide exchange factor [Dictyostelium discoideum AX4]|eukprot:XP_642150.1 Ras guanine nucleotide exchange factor [Dictyostelium discoideum AX4]
MSNPVCISNSTNGSSNSLNGESVSPNRLGSSPGSPISKASSFDLNGKKPTKSNVVRLLLNRTNSGSNLLSKRRTSETGDDDSNSSVGLLNNSTGSIGKMNTPESSPKSSYILSSSIGSGGSGGGGGSSGSLQNLDSASNNSSGPRSRSGSLGKNNSSQQNNNNLILDPNFNNIDKSLWTVRSLKEHSNLVDIMERIKPASRAISFGQIYASEETQFEFDPVIGRDNILQLILQHLQFEGLMDSRKILEEEAKIQYPEYTFNESRLVTLLRAVIKDSDKVFDLTLNDRDKDSQQKLEEHLAFLGLFKDESQTNMVEDVNIYDEPENSNIIYVDEKDNDKPSKDSPTTATTTTTATTIAPSTSINNLSSLSVSISSNNINNNNNNNNNINNLNSTQLISNTQQQQATPNTPPQGLKSTQSITGSTGTLGPQVKAASLNKLVILLTPENNHDLEYTKTFLLMYQSFTTPEILLQKLIQRYHVPQKAGQSVAEWRQRSTHIQLRVLNVLKTWIKDYFSDFSEKLILAIKSLLESMRQTGNMSYAKVISDALNSGLKKSGRNNTVFTVSAPEPKVPKNIWSHNLDIFSVDEEEISRQLTLMDFEIFSNIKSTELLNQCWNKPKLRHRSPNVLELIGRFNEISQWTATSILSWPKVKDRARIMGKFIKIAEYCMKHLNNFNTSMAILSGLNASSVHRLKFTKEELPRHTQQVYTELQFHLSSAQAYKEYRALLAKANPPCLPYLGVYLTDLTFFEEGNPDFIQGFINFGKRKLIYGSISNVQSFQNTKYNLQPVYQIAKLLKGFKLLEENELYTRSMSFEPRNKERSEIL